MDNDLKVRILTAQAAIDQGNIKELRIKVLDLREIDPQLNFFDRLEKKNSKIAILKRKVKALEEEKVLLLNLMCPACEKRWKDSLSSPSS